MAERTVLFICVENACRSLMAEAMFNEKPPEGWRATSAGTEPAPGANAKTAIMLAEIGLEIPAHAPQILTNQMMKESSVRITMGCVDGAKCPAQLKELEVTDWDLADPGKLDDAGFREVRDGLRDLVEGLRRELGRRHMLRAQIGIESPPS